MSAQPERPTHAHFSSLQVRPLRFRLGKYSLSASKQRDQRSHPKDFPEPDLVGRRRRPTNAGKLDQPERDGSKPPSIDNEPSRLPPNVADQNQHGPGRLE